MPKSTDNQDYSENTSPSEKNQQNQSGGAKGKGQEDENNFTSDDQKGKKIDADLSKETDRPAEQSS